MTVTAKTLINAKFASNSITTEYTVAANTKAIIDKFTATNTDSGAVTITINIVPSGSSSGTSNIIIKAQSLAAGATYDFTQMQNQILNAGDFVRVTASVASVMVIRMSGREVT